MEGKGKQQLQRDQQSLCMLLPWAVVDGQTRLGPIALALIVPSSLMRKGRSRCGQVLASSLRSFTASAPVASRLNSLELTLTSAMRSLTRLDHQQCTASGPAAHCLPFLPSPQETAQPARPKGLRRCIKCITAVIVLGVVTAAVLVPIALITGVNHRRPAATQRTVPQPATAHKILFAFKNLTIYPKAASIFSTAIAEEVTQWVVLPSSRVHVAAFSNHLAMQQALAALSNTASLKYAMADFHLVADRGANRLINPDQLLELSKELPARHLLQQTGSAKTAASQHATKINTAGRHVNVPQASRLVATHKQRLAERKARRQLLSQQRSLAAAHLPSTARTHQHSLDGAAPGMQQPETFGCTSTGCTPLLGMSDEAAALSPCTAGQHLNSRAYGTLCADSRWINSSIVGVTASRRQQRQLKQYQEPPPPPEPQPQQRQALIQPQRGGTGVAWYLADPALQTKAAWNITYGKSHDKNVSVHAL